MRNIIIFVFISFIYSFAELIDGPANVRNEPKGEIIFQLEDSTFVEADSLKNNWYPFTLIVYIETKNLSIFENGDDCFIKAGSIFYSEGGEIIGKCISKFQAYNLRPISDSRNSVVIWGYTYLKNIRESSIPERIIESILENNNNHTGLSFFEPYLETMKFGKWEDENNFKIFSKSEPDYIMGSDFRLLLAFYENQLIGIMHLRQMKFTNIQVIDRIRSHKFVYFKNVSKEIIDEFRKRYYLRIQRAG